MTTNGRPALEVDEALIRRLRDSGDGWQKVSKRYTAITGQYISKDTAKRRYGGFAPLLRRGKAHREGVAMTLISRTYADRNAGYDTAWIVRLDDGYFEGLLAVLPCFFHLYGVLCQQGRRQAYLVFFFFFFLSHFPCQVAIWDRALTRPASEMVRERRMNPSPCLP